ncbi:uncharacterized protein LOC134727255 [Mytilus trossulus]|uniref:uncharacterized protein LOC134727255 n=1 Tax=Mytilus trossulus TaxID=6551 RepID=UPI003007EE77
MNDILFGNYSKMVRVADYLVINLLVLYISSKGLAETLLCVRCSSDSDPECEDDPKSPSPCPESQQRSACQTVREKNVKGEIVKFIRGCSTVSLKNNMEASDCRKRNDNITVCYELCFTDGCNLGTQFSLSPSLWIFLVLLLLGL